MAKTLLLSFSILLLINTISSYQIKIGAVFEKNDDETMEKMLQTAIAIINELDSLGEDTEMHLITKRVPKGDTFEASRAVCDMMKEGTVAIFGPMGRPSYHVQSICDTLEIPHIITKSDATLEKTSTVINLYPHYATISNILVKLVDAYGWKTFTVFYENSESLPKLSELIKMHDGNAYIVSMRQLDIGNGGNYRPIFNEVKKSGDTKYIIDCSIDILYDVLIQAQQVGLMSNDHSYIITNFDFHTIDIDPFKYGGSNITGLRLVDPEDPETIEAVEELNNMLKQMGDVELFDPYTFKSEAALLLDSLNVLFIWLKDLYSNEELKVEYSFSCDEYQGWQHASSMMNDMRTIHIRGITGHIKFDSNDGFRTDFPLDIMELIDEGLVKIGSWNSTQGLNITRIDSLKAIPALEGSLSNESFIVITAISEPYGMLKNSTSALKGNNQYEGFGIELIEEISKMLGFNYTFTIEPNAAYGTMDSKTGQWNGMIKELLEERADLAITDLTITAERQTAVDFTNPFMTLGIGILYKKPMKEPPKLFSFMSPFSNDVWLSLGSAYLGVSILLFITARIAPKEWQNPYPCIQEPEKLENQFSIPNSLWFTVGSVLQQGSELAPIAMSTRMIAGIWWFFTLIMVSSYTANLAAFLTIEPVSKPFETVEELANNKVGIKYGSKKGGSTLNFFKDSNRDVYRKMYEFMTENDVLMPNNIDGLKRVQNENYAYFMESTSIEYLKERQCDVTQVGNLLDSKGYGIAMRKNMYYHNLLTKAVLVLQEQGVLHKMKDKWWKEKGGGGACIGADADSGGAVALNLANVGGVFVLLVAGCFIAMLLTISEMLIEVWKSAKDNKETSNPSQELDLRNVGGVFVVLVAGCILATLTAIGEMLHNVTQRSKKYKVSFRQELKDELKFVAKCSGDTKPVRHRQNSSSPETGSEKSTSGKSKGSKRSKEHSKSLDYSLDSKR